MPPERGLAALDGQIAGKQNAITRLIEDQKRLRETLSGARAARKNETRPRATQPI